MLLTSSGRTAMTGTATWAGAAGAAGAAGCAAGCAASAPGTARIAHSPLTHIRLTIMFTGPRAVEMSELFRRLRGEDLHDRNVLEQVRGEHVPLLQVRRAVI